MDEWSVKKFKKLAFNDIFYGDPINLLSNIIFPELEKLKFQDDTFILDNVLDEIKYLSINCKQMINTVRNLHSSAP